MSPTPEGNERDKIVDAAIRCFERFGPQRTSMNDIADEAGTSRRTLYRQFDDRPALVAEILDRRLSELHASVLAHLATYNDIEEALVEGSLFSVEVGERDTLFVDVVTHEHDRSIERFLLGDTGLHFATQILSIHGQDPIHAAGID